MEKTKCIQDIIAQMLNIDPENIQIIPMSSYDECANMKPTESITEYKGLAEELRRSGFPDESIDRIISEAQENKTKRENAVKMQEKMRKETENNAVSMAMKKIANAFFYDLENAVLLEDNTPQVGRIEKQSSCVTEYTPTITFDITQGGFVITPVQKTVAPTQCGVYIHELQNAMNMCNALNKISHYTWPRISTDEETE